MASALETLLLALTAPLAVPVNATPVSTGSNGTVTSGTTETFDAVLGYYQCQLIAGRRYMAVVNNLLIGASASPALYAARIRNSGSSSNPTSASTCVASAQWVAPGTGGGNQETLYVAGSFIAPTTGINTFGLSLTQFTGSGTATPLSPTANRELFVMYLGTV